MSTMDFIFLPLQLATIVVLCHGLVVIVRDVRATSTVAPWPVRLAGPMLTAAVAFWVIAGVAVAFRELDLSEGIDAVVHGLLMLMLMTYLTLSLLRGGRASYWVLLLMVVPAVLLAGAMAIVIVGRDLLTSGWPVVFAGLSWVTCASGLVLIVLPGSFRFFREAYLSSMKLKNGNESRVG